MKKNYFLTALILLSSMAFSQKALILNGGQFGNPQENVNLQIYDVLSQQYSQIDTIYTESVQELILEGEFAFIAAQDSIVKYNLSNETRVAAAEFLGMSTKDLCIVGNELWVSNFYGQSNNNIYIYDKDDLSFIDSIIDVSRASGSMVYDGNDFVYASQNSSSASFADTLGIIIKIDANTKAIVDTIDFDNYTENIGQLFIHNNLLISINANTIATASLSNNQKNRYDYNHYFGVGNQSGYSIYSDTLFLIADADIAAISLNDFSVLDSNILGTDLIAFDYDTINHHFYTTRTDFFSYTEGAIYDRSGQNLDSLIVGFSPEAVRIYYDTKVGLTSKIQESKEFKVYPNPAVDRIQIDFEGFGEQLEMTIFNQVGAVVHSEYIHAKSKVDVSKLSRGIYFVMLQSKENQGVQKLIIR